MPPKSTAAKDKKEIPKKDADKGKHDKNEKKKGTDAINKAQNKKDSI